MVGDVVAMVCTLNAWVGRLGERVAIGVGALGPARVRELGVGEPRSRSVRLHLRRGQLVEQQTLLNRKLPGAGFSRTSSYPEAWWVGLSLLREPDRR